MISDNQPAAYELGDREHDEEDSFRMFIFLCDTIDSDFDNARKSHLFIFDETGGLYEARYFYPERWRDALIRSITRDGKPPMIWELVPHGEPPLPDSRYWPLRVPEGSEMTFDKLYAIELRDDGGGGGYDMRGAYLSPAEDII